MARQMNLLTRTMFGGPEMRWFSSKVFPAVNITEDPDKYYVRAELPGIKSDKIDLQVNGRTLTISGERKFQSVVDTAKYHRKERDAGRFARAIKLPGDIDAGGVDARVVDGVLTVEIPKSEASKPKQIAIN